MTDYRVLAVQDRDRLGEGPWWDAATSRLWWVDILGRRIRNADLSGSEAAPIETPSEVGFAVPDEQGGILAGLRDGLWRRSPDGDWLRLWQADHDPSAFRLNDGKVDPQGRVWFGSMHDAETEPAARLYCFDSGEVRPVLDGVTTSNGLGWSPDGDTFYYTDSPSFTIWAFEVDPSTGVLGNRRVFARDPEAYFPDGLTVDADGFVWSAKWNGGRLVRYAPDGRIDTEVALPVRKTTCPAFVGDDLSLLAVTSAALAPDDGELAGAVFLLPSGTRGLPACLARLG